MAVESRLLQLDDVLKQPMAPPITRVEITISIDGELKQLLDALLNQKEAVTAFLKPQSNSRHRRWRFWQKAEPNG